MLASNMCCIVPSSESAECFLYVASLAAINCICRRVIYDLWMISLLVVDWRDRDDLVLCDYDLQVIVGLLFYLARNIA
jgi:hypothetical protein